MSQQFRISSCGRPRTEWRDSYAEAMQDAVDAGLASRDHSRRTWYLAVPVAMERRGRVTFDEPRRPRLREPWSHADEIALRSAAARGQDRDLISSMLGRSERAIAWKAKQFGLEIAQPGQ